ncbi:MAG TPA: glycoside hydrolase family 20 zincin-like fold domain-containing protein, partial [Bacteroidales bacterium]|nr:glycoside hydrolase family 20 zincin-like fold domain-containing protein [Bacteroidales bacterium]HQJ21663.1 glycoside hydrolase family 20 zincin-like fold domain-containing protein [Bacteroidales bacterium]
MKNVYFILFSILLVLCGCNKGGSGSDEPNVYAIIPAPVSIQELSGKFTFGPKTQIIVSPLNQETKLSADFLGSLINNALGFTPVVKEGGKAAKGSVFMAVDTAIKNIEGYTLSVGKNKIIVKAGSGAGLFHAVQSIRQLMPHEVEKTFSGTAISLTVPCCEIKDEPRFVY